MAFRSVNKMRSTNVQIKISQLNVSENFHLDQMVSFWVDISFWYRIALLLYHRTNANFCFSPERDVKREGRTKTEPERESEIG